MADAELFCLDLGMAIGRLPVDADELDPVPLSTSAPVEDGVRRRREDSEEQRAELSGKEKKER